MQTIPRQTTARLWAHHPIALLGWLRAAIGGAVGIAMAGGATWVVLQLLAHLDPGPVSDAGLSVLPLLAAPLGASAVLVFCLPASPLAQPWPVIGGDLLSACVGLAIGHLLGDPIVAGALAVGTAIAVMTLLRCLHPPGGACALLCALGASGKVPWDASYLLPIAANVVMLCLAGWAYNSLTGHRWPHRAAPAAHPLHVPPYTRDDIMAVLEEWDDALDVDVDDLDAFIQALLQRAGAGR